VELRESLAQDNDRGIDQSKPTFEMRSMLKREVREYYSEDEMMTCLALSVASSLGNAIAKYLVGRAKLMAETRPYSSGGSSRRRPTYQDDWDDEDNDWL